MAVAPPHEKKVVEVTPLHEKKVVVVAPIQENKVAVERPKMIMIPLIDKFHVQSAYSRSIKEVHCLNIDSYITNIGKLLYNMRYAMFVNFYPRDTQRYKENIRLIEYLYSTYHE